MLLVRATPKERTERWSWSFERRDEWSAVWDRVGVPGAWIAPLILNTSAWLYSAVRLGQISNPWSQLCTYAMRRASRQDLELSILHPSLLTGVITC